MTLGDQVFGALLLMALLTCLLYVIFGQVTVKKLRKNPATREQLGVSVASGWDILNVAGALSRPKWLSERLRRSPLSFTAADERPLYAYTTRFDRFLARVFFWLWTVTGIGIISTVIFTAVGLID